MNHTSLKYPLKSELGDTPVQSIRHCMYPMQAMVVVAGGSIAWYYAKMESMILPVLGLVDRLGNPSKESAFICSISRPFPVEGFGYWCDSHNVPYDYRGDFSLRQIRNPVLMEQSLVNQNPWYGESPRRAILTGLRWSFDHLDHVFGLRPGEWNEGGWDFGVRLR